MSAAYKEAFPKGTRVRIVDKEALSRFKATWKCHHPLGDEQFAFADSVAVVSDVGFYHGGDVLYQLRGISGTWHEECLRAEGAA